MLRFTSPAIDLGQGLWLAKTTQSVTTAAISFVTPATGLQQDNADVKGLIMLASTNNLHLDNIQCVVDLIYNKQVSQLFNSDTKTIIELLTQPQPSGITATFTIDNKLLDHGQYF